MNLPHQLQRALRALGIPAHEKKILVAVSGGADSVALLLALHGLAPRLGLQLKVAHLHHGLRGAEADGDARFVRALARRLKIPCVAGRAHVQVRAKRRGVSREMAAREARYAFLLKTARAWALRQAQGRAGVVIATAHTADDQAETVLLRLARGAGMRELAGIPPERDAGGVRVVRPLLGVRRRAIEAFLASVQQPWREDASNRDPTMLRNRVRHEILPLLAARLNPRIVEALVRTAEFLRTEGAQLDQHGARGARPPLVALQVPGDTRIPELGLVVRVREGREIVRERGIVGVWPARASLAWKRLGRRRLTVRTWQPGDRIKPFGMTGSRKLQDVFTDAKVPAAARARIPVFACGDEVVWVPGYRIAQGWEIREPGERILDVSVRRLRA